MRIVERLPDFPKRVVLRGLQLEAYQMLQERDARNPVLKISIDGQNVAAVKRAFAAAAKFMGGSVETRNAEDGTILVKWSSTSRTRGRGGAVRKAKPQHSDDAIEREAKRLHEQKGGGSYDSLSADARRKLTISAKRNLSRRA
jgi:hypothetical protein